MEDQEGNKMLQQPVQTEEDHQNSYVVDPKNNQTNSSNRDFLAKVIVAEQDLTQSNGSLSDETNVPYLFVDLNDVVSVEGDLDDRFILAKSDQQVGRLASTACLILDEQIPTTSCQYLADNQFYDLHICFASFVAQDVGDLSITKGDIIVAITSVNEHWLQGQVCFDSQANSWPKLILGNQAGTFPLNHCWKLDSERVKTFCQSKLKQEQRIVSTITSTPWSTVDLAVKQTQKPILATKHSSSLSSGGSSSLCSTDNNNYNNNQQLYQNQHISYNHHQQVGKESLQQLKHDKVDSGSVQNKPPPRPEQLPRQISNRQLSSSVQAISRQPSIMSSKQQDKLKGWLHTVRKKTARCAMRISANLGLISLTRDEEFERHHESFKQLEKSIRVFIKNLTMFVEHFESFLLALQTTSDNLADFYRDKTHQKEITEMRKKNKALNCEHFHAFKRTVDRQVIAVASQLLQKFTGPHQLIHKRSAKLLDYDTRTKEVESCRDLDKKTALREQYVIAKELYDRINGQLIEELPIFNRFSLNIFRECILVLLESRRNLIMAYTKQTEALLKTPLLSSFTASDVASTIMMTRDFVSQRIDPVLTENIQSSMDNTMAPVAASPKGINSDYCKSSRATSEHETQPSTSGTLGDGSSTRPSSELSQLSSEFDQMGLANRDICSTPLSQISGSRRYHVPLDDDEHNEADQPRTGADILSTDDVGGSPNPYDEPDKVLRFAASNRVSSDNKQNENIETAIEALRADGLMLRQSATSKGGCCGVNSAKDSRKKKQTKREFFIASWAFVATGPNQLTISRNQPLKLLKGCDSIGNPDWSLVKNQSNDIGYVPTAYLKKRDN